MAPGLSQKRYQNRILGPLEYQLSPLESLYIHPVAEAIQEIYGEKYCKKTLNCDLCSNVINMKVHKS